MPKGIQRRRVKGWRMPEGAVSVCRPHRHGNPYKESIFGEKCLVLFENSARGIWVPQDMSDELNKLAYDLHKQYMKRFDIHPLEAIRVELRGKDLACFCALGTPCHRDILLRLANPEA